MNVKDERPVPEHKAGTAGVLGRPSQNPVAKSTRDGLGTAAWCLEAEEGRRETVDSGEEGASPCEGSRASVVRLQINLADDVPLRPVIQNKIEVSRTCSFFHARFSTDLTPSVTTSSLNQTCK